MIIIMSRNYGAIAVSPAPSICLTKIRVYGQFCIETLHEKHNGIELLVVCLSKYLPLCTCSVYPAKFCVVWQNTLKPRTFIELERGP